MNKIIHIILLWKTDRMIKKQNKKLVKQLESIIDDCQKVIDKNSVEIQKLRKKILEEGRI